jgi:hypothetical protein
MNFCLQCNSETQRKKFCSNECGMDFHNSKRKVVLGWIKNPPIKKYFCKWCNEILSGQKRKFCSIDHGLLWNEKNNPDFNNQRKRAAKKYHKKNRKLIHQRKTKRKWIKRAGVESFEEFQNLEIKKEKFCKYCNGLFFSKWADQVFCCKSCSLKFHYEFGKVSPERIATKKKYQLVNKDKIKAGRYRWIKNLPNDHNYKIRGQISGRIHNAIKACKNAIKSNSTMRLIGCTVPELKIHIEKQFKPGMEWSNHGLRGWHIDHVKPCAVFDLKNPEEQKKCFHYSNLQPLWAKENLEKSDKYLKMPTRKVKL